MKPLNIFCGRNEEFFVLKEVMGSIYRVPQKSVNLKHSLVLTRMFTFKRAIQFLERYNSVVSCAFNMEDLILDNFCKSNK
jgi:hypothetical protein